MSRTKKFFLRVWQFISIFGFFFGLLFGVIFSFGFWLYGQFLQKEVIFQHKLVLTRILKEGATISEIKKIFGEGLYFDFSSRNEVEKTWDQQIMTKFNQYPSMLFYTIGDFHYFIFFDQKGKMIDFEVRHS